MFYIYNIFNQAGELLYVGSTSSSVSDRVADHRKHHPWGAEISQVMVTTVENHTTMDIYEKYLINKLKPKHNATSNEAIAVELPELEFQEYDPADPTQRATIKVTYRLDTENMLILRKWIAKQWMAQGEKLHENDLMNEAIVLLLEKYGME